MSHDLELEAAAKKLVEAELMLGTLESQAAVLKYSKCQTIANAFGIGQSIYEWKTWVESMSTRMTLDSNPALRLKASQKTLPEGCEFTETEIAEVREWLKQKSSVTAAQNAFDAAIANRAYSVKEAVRNRCQESKAKGYPTQAEIAAREFTEVAL